MSGAQGYFGVWNKVTGASERFPLTDEGWTEAWSRFAGQEQKAAAEFARAFVGPSFDQPRTAGLQLPERPALHGCAICHRSPTDHFTFRSNQGLLLTRRRFTFEGSLCRDCARGAFRTHQARNMTWGWWGLISFFVTIGYLISNIREVSKARALSEPRPEADEERQQELRGRPVLFRPLSWVGIILLGAALFGVYTYEKGPGPLESIDRDFSDPSSGPPTFDRPGVTARYEDGRYRIRIDADSEIIDSVLPSSLPAVTVGVDARKTSSSSDEGYFGVGCVADHGRQQAYHFVVDPDAHEFVVLKSDRDEGGVLDRGTDDAILATDDPIEIKGQCSSVDGTVSLVMFVNGRQVTTLTDHAGFASFEGMALVVLAKDAGADATFFQAWLHKV